jgi:signal peptidase I
MLYLAQLRWAGIYVVAGLVIAIVGEVYFREAGVAELLQLAFVFTCVVHAYRLAGSYRDGDPRPAYSRWYGLVGATVCLIVFAFGLRAFVVETFRFPSGSMQPTVPPKGLLVVQKWGYGNYSAFGLRWLRTGSSSPLGRGEIIVFEYPQDRSIHFAKRLIGLPGDKIIYRGNKLTVNGIPIPLREDGAYYDRNAATRTPKYVESLGGTEYSVLIDNRGPANLPTSIAFPFRDSCTYHSDGVSCEVPVGNYYAMGDNRNHSADSRIWGFVPADHIVGKVVLIVQ